MKKFAPHTERSRERRREANNCRTHKIKNDTKKPNLSRHNDTNETEQKKEGTKRKDKKKNR